MLHLAFETSCDDTSIALMEDNRVLQMVTRSQIAEHADTQGVVPEVAARLHANVVFGVLDEVLRLGNVWLSDIQYIDCTSEPGLLPSLLVGKTVAKTLAHGLWIPLQWIHHIEGHIFANLLERDVSEISFPAVVLTVSGGHNEIYLWKSLYEWELLGQTRDDAAGEAFDKVAKAMGLGFPGGPIVAKYASEYTGAFSWLFPIPLLESESLDFSFSWLKSAVRREVEARKVKNFGVLSQNDLREIAFEFEQSIVTVLATKLNRAAKKTWVNSIMLAGGVSANDLLRNTLEQMAKQEGYAFLAPVKKVYSMDNAAMIGIRWYYEHARFANS
jgi:N6-L-threonylcarbamoyladenine synthase